MKIDPSRRVDIAATRKTRKPGEADGVRFSGLLGETGESGSAAPAAAATAMDGLLAIQETGADGKDGGSGQARGEALLEGLERLRDGLLAGAVPEAELRGLTASVAQIREGSFTDPGLGEILDEIELRARVELAKLGTFL